MRLMLFSHKFPPLNKESDDALFCLLKKYSQNPNIKVDVITSSDDEKKHLFKLGNNISIYRLPIEKRIDKEKYQSDKEIDEYGQEIYNFAQELARENDYDLTHSFYAIPCGITSMLLKKNFKIPYVVSLRNPDISFLEKSADKTIVEILKNICNDAHLITASSYELQKMFFENGFQKKVSLLYDGINIEKIPTVQSDKDVEHFSILCDSDVIPEKGVRFLIQAFEILAGRYKNIRLFIVGDGNERSSLENLIQALGLEDKIIFTGELSEEKKLEYYQKANLFVLPALEESIDNSIFKAMAFGLPIVISDTNIAREIFEKNVNCLMAKMRDVNDLFEKIEAFLLDNNLGIKMGKKNKETIDERFSWNFVAKKYFEIYAETIKH